MPEDPTSEAASSLGDNESEFLFEHHEARRSLSLKEAAAVLGKSMRALERSLTGKWGNHLPEGWLARKEMLDGQEQWRILPPAEFDLERGFKDSHAHPDQSLLERALTGNLLGTIIQAATGTANQSVWEKEPSQLALASSTDMLQLMRELAGTQKSLVAEQKAHLDDLKLLFELQSSMKLIRANENDTAVLKKELLEAQHDLVDLRNRYQELARMPWWKRLFKQNYQ